MPADYSDIEQCEAKMKSTSAAIRKLEPLVALALTAKEYDSDRRKSLLAKYMVKYLKEPGMSSSSAEAKARADAQYIEELNSQAAEYESAMLTLKKESNETRAWETARSCLSRIKATISKFQE